MKLAFAGFRHTHIFSLYEAAKNHEAVEIVGSWEQDEAARNAAAENNGVVFNYESYEDILNDENVDAVAIGDYYAARGALAIAALKAGKHVVSDKPLCTSLSELDEIERLSKEKGLSVFLMLDLRSHGNILAAKKAIEDGEIGEVHNIQFGGQHPLLYGGSRPGWYFEEGKYGGVINDIAIHGIDLIPYMTGLTVKEVIGARCWNAYATEKPNFLDCGQFMLSLSNGGGVIADVSYASPDSIRYRLPYYWQFLIWGSGGMIGFSGKTDGIMLYKNGEEEGIALPKRTVENSYLHAFVDEVAGKKNDFLTTAEVLRAARATLEIQAQADR